MAGILKIFYIMIIYVSLFLVVFEDESKLILIFFILDTIFYLYLVILLYPYFTLQESVLLTPIVRKNILVLLNIV